MARKKRTRRQKWIRFVKFEMLLLGLLCIAIMVFFASGYAGKISTMKSDADFLVSNSDKNTFRTAQTSIAYDVNGDTLSVLKGEKDVYYVESDEIPNYAKQAIVSIEDKKYYSHHGVDYKAIIRAAWAYLRNRRITQGASTITQQLAKNVFLTSEKTWERKVEEIFIASDLEKKYSKSAILEFYLNNIYFGNGYYGIQAASRGYFNKDVDELSLSQAAFLCAIPNRPTYYDPKEHFDHTMKRRNQILDAMLDDKVITEETYKQAVRETITLEEPPDEEKHNYAETYTFYCATRALMEMDGFEFRTVFDSDEEKQEYEEDYDAAYEECNAKLYTGGFRIYTSLDLGTQDMLQSTMDEALAGFDETTDDGVFALQSASVCIDNTTGMVRAIVGGRSQDVTGYTLNRAFQSFRQPGSTIKPLIVYTPALEHGYNANTVVQDTQFEGGPANSGGGYSGSITLRTAVEQSKNTVAWQIFTDLTPEVGISYLEKMQFARLDENDKNPAASLGGFTNGVSPLEMAKGYATIENDGAYRDPTCILKITDSEGSAIYQPSKKEEVVYQEEAAREMTDILQGVLIRGTGVGLGLGDMPCAGKTGTTNDNKDGWFVGYTRYYTTSVWVGYDTPRTMYGLYGATYPGKIWHNFMTTLHEGLEPKDFVKPENYEYIPEVVEEEAPEEVTDEAGEALEAQPEEVQEGGVVEEGVDEVWEDDTGAVVDDGAGAGDAGAGAEVPAETPIEEPAEVPATE
ncbi:MAG: PBP1A family penicillin-binding protein [Lachnospiraceae bacterium]|nr:PBP1A family penicillin-binding protein [Lachnospiraceae bacterium]